MRERALRALSRLTRRGGEAAKPRCFSTAPPPPPPTAAARSSSGGPVSWRSLALVSLTGAGLVTFYNVEKSRRMEAALAKIPVKTVGKASVGGPWELLDEQGRKCTNEDLKGAFTILYFGFTHCPDICPDELVKLSEAIDLVEKQTGKQVTPVFITLDPARDGVKQVREYVREFHPRMRGFTGSQEACNAAARAFRVYHHKTEETEGDYLVDHSIIMYLLDPAGDFVAFYGKNVDAAGLSTAVSEHVRRWTWPEGSAASVGSAKGASAAAPAKPAVAV